jgi:hypothetical protein
MADGRKLKRFNKTGGEKDGKPSAQIPQTIPKKEDTVPIHFSQRDAARGLGYSTAQLERAVRELGKPTRQNTITLFVDPYRTWLPLTLPDIEERVIRRRTYEYILPDYPPGKKWKNPLPTDLYQMDFARSLGYSMRQLEEAMRKMGRPTRQNIFRIASFGFQSWLPATLPGIEERLRRKGKNLAYRYVPPDRPAGEKRKNVLPTRPNPLKGRERKRGFPGQLRHMKKRRR